jgi:hypothetical protein
MCVSVGGWSGGVLQGVGMGVFADVSVFVYHICANAYMYYVHMQTYTCMVYMNVCMYMYIKHTCTVNVWGRHMNMETLTNQ